MSLTSLPHLIQYSIHLYITLKKARQGWVVLGIMLRHTNPIFKQEYLWIFK